MYAVIKTGGKQYKVATGDVVKVEKIAGEEGKEVIFKMFDNSINYLKKDGVLMIVIRKDQGAPSAKTKLASIYGNCDTLDREKGYHILKCIKTN